MTDFLIEMKLTLKLTFKLLCIVLKVLALTFVAAIPCLIGLAIGCIPLVVAGAAFATCFLIAVLIRYFERKEGTKIL